MKGIHVRIWKDRLVTGTIWLLSLLPLIPLALILFFIVSKGFSCLSWSFLTSLPKPPGETGGGVFNAIVGTVMLIVLASILAVPMGVMAGVYLSEFKGKTLPGLVRTAADLLQGIPSIVVGIIAYAWVVLPMHHFNALAGGVALALIMIPIIVRTTEEVLILVPQELREASLALGACRWRTILKVVIPTGMAGITTGILVSIARIAGETAPLLFTAFGNPFLTFKVTEPVNALPLVIFNYATSPYQDWWRQAWGASIVLVAMVFLLNITAKAIAKRIGGSVTNE